jgi:hypothetical protein
VDYTWTARGLIMVTLMMFPVSFAVQARCPFSEIGSHTALSGV